MATHHARHPSHTSKKSLPAHARSNRPTSKRSHSHGKSGSKNAHPKEEEFESWDDGDMAVSFLNFCTVCEKQIITPSNSILYCSESCRRKDTEKSLTYAFEHHSPPTTPFANFSFEDFHFRDIVPQRSPTHAESKRSSCAFSDISSDDNTWSINEKSQSSNTEASRYLRQFQSSAYTPEAHRPRYNRTSASQVSFSAAPSLSHTPASSISYSLPYTPATARPLPPRYNPHSSSYGSKSIELVTPVTAPSSPKYYSHKSLPISTTSTSTIEGEIVYHKSPVPSLSAANGSLGRLLASTPRA
ncbi:hypothetical protein CC86DRAFT_144962 [Ophiobolus disseminans]|uniref:Life-span regulatory factor-domain-containing protein n=1 Tax=Ophiobolus disseminans TaxID=1469910 RepID=A0A6A6ZER1_9PLEO|nr:hypothetical protein CC86DRAFT_144962 [Ophiobolus disseminans]